MRRNGAFTMFIAIRRFATKTVAVPHFDKEVIQQIENETLHPRHHPGRLRSPIHAIPEEIVEAIKVVLKDFSTKSLLNDGKIVYQHFKERRKPPERKEVAQKAQEIQAKILDKFDDFDPSNVSDRQERKVTKEVVKSLLRQTYVWAPSDFSDYLCFPYLVSKSAGEHSILCSIFAEINQRDPSFQPKTVFDFGSGVGTVIWASQSVWKDSITEYVCIDSSNRMIEIAEQILAGAKVGGKPSIKAKVYHRQFLPSSRKKPYDVVVSAFSLLELPDTQSRLDTVRNLWHKTNDYLVLVELGTKVGFEVINEARDYLLNIMGTSRHYIPEGHVFSPCPHEQLCPKALRGEACFFKNLYFQLELDGKKHQCQERYSYVVLKKGKRSSEDPLWPRVVEPVLVRRKTAHCRVCTAEGKFRDLTFSKKNYATKTYWCVRMSTWGDRVPIVAIEDVIKDESSGEAALESFNETSDGDDLMKDDIGESIVENSRVHVEGVNEDTLADGGEKDRDLMENIRSCKTVLDAEHTDSNKPQG